MEILLEITNFFSEVVIQTLFKNLLEKGSPLHCSLSKAFYFIILNFQSVKAFHECMNIK